VNLPDSAMREDCQISNCTEAQIQDILESTFGMYGICRDCWQGTKKLRT
jgi:hypothetical protein